MRNITNKLKTLIMEILLDDYKRKLDTVADMLYNMKNSGSIIDVRQRERLSTKSI